MTDQRIKVKPLSRPKNGTVLLWVTVYRDFDNGVELVIGAPSKTECAKAFERVSKGFRCDKDKIIHAQFRKADAP